ncbi:hypothetical protein GCM10010259_39460 [Streptomyces daghestanicus]|uniref:Uncharacterized protein n=1 Tax=Streptomyces daghestanicus TaxID=66885 RepID=A0ABQ3QB78_9ACTN|nr:hypothetical protein GCM10010259_39460 [Streptomyces daghestanicus]GHI34537.1 hypothetical protein Sdagh_62670 [Streptomyces daghestanicus]
MPTRPGTGRAARRAPSPGTTPAEPVTSAECRKPKKRQNVVSLPKQRNRCLSQRSWEYTYLAPDRTRSPPAPEDLTQ